MSLVAEVLYFVLDIAWFLVIAHVIMSWLVGFNVLNVRQPLVAQIWSALDRLLEPVYSRIRQFLPNTGAFDLSPLVLLVGLFALRTILSSSF